MRPLPVGVSVLQRVVQAVGIPVEVLRAAGVLHVVVHGEEGAGDGGPAAEVVGVDVIETVV